MEKKRIEIIVVSVLGIFLVVLLISTLGGKKKKMPEQKEESEEVIEEMIVPAAFRPGPAAPTGETTYAEPADLDWGRDPFTKVHTVMKKSKKHLLILSAVIWDEKEPHAIINNEVVVTGEEIDGYRVKKINNNNVVLEKAGREITIELYQ